MGPVLETSAHLEVGRVGQVLDNHVRGKNSDPATVEVEGDVLFERGPAADVEEGVGTRSEVSDCLRGYISSNAHT